MKINQYHLMHIWDPVCDLNPPDINRADMAVLANQKKLVFNHIKPYWESFLKPVNYKVKEAWRYSLHYPQDGYLKYALDSMLVPFRTKGLDIKQFYVDIWDLMFDGEPWQLSEEEINKYEVVNKWPPDSLWGHPPILVKIEDMD